MSEVSFSEVRYVAADSPYVATTKTREFQRLTYQDAQDDIDGYYAELGYEPGEMHVYTVTVCVKLAPPIATD